MLTKFLPLCRFPASRGKLCWFISVAAGVGVVGSTNVAGDISVLSVGINEQSIIIYSVLTIISIIPGSVASLASNRGASSRGNVGCCISSVGAVGVVVVVNIAAGISVFSVGVHWNSIIIY